MISKPLINVTFTGILADVFGTTHQFRAASMKEIGSALRVCIPGFADWVTAKIDENIMYEVMTVRGTGRSRVTAERWDWPIGNARDVIVSPVAVGAGGETWSFIGGAILIGIGAWTGQGYLIAAGGSMILGGVARLMAPQPPTPKDAEKERSFLFSGLRSTSDEDQPVPLIYGRCFVPLKLEISRQVTTTEERLT